MHSDKINIIYLAAGNSRRYKGNKLLDNINGKEMYRHTLDILLDYVSQKENISLVVVTQYAPIMEYVSQRADWKVVITYSPQSVNGMSYSIKNGLISAIYPDGFNMFVVADQPWLSIDTIDGLITGMLESKKRAGCVRSSNGMGNPVIFSKEYTKDLMKLKDDMGGKSLIQHKIEECYFYDTVSRELTDIDYKLYC